MNSQKAPSEVYAVVKLKEEKFVELSQLLNRNGFNDVCFVNSLDEHPSMENNERKRKIFRRRNSSTSSRDSNPVSEDTEEGMMPQDTVSTEETAMDEANCQYSSHEVIEEAELSEQTDEEDNIRIASWIAMDRALNFEDGTQTSQNPVRNLEILFSSIVKNQVPLGAYEDIMKHISWHAEDALTEKNNKLAALHERIAKKFYKGNRKSFSDSPHKGGLAGIRKKARIDRKVEKKEVITEDDRLRLFKVVLHHVLYQVCYWRNVWDNTEDTINDHQDWFAEILKFQVGQAVQADEE